MPLAVAVRACAEAAAPPAGAVHISLVDLAGDDRALARAESSLTPAEVARARRGTPAVHRRRVLLRAVIEQPIAAAS